MSTSVINPAAGSTPSRARIGSAHSSSWAWAGAIAGVLGIAGFFLSGAVAPTRDELADNATVLAAIEGAEWAVWVYQSLTVATAAALVVFAAGLRRRLDEQAPVGSLLPTVAFTGLALVAAMSLVGGGISTELFWNMTAGTGEVDPDTVAANLGVFNTMGWVWAGMGLTSGAVAIAALRHGSLPRWIGWCSVVATALIALLQLVPLQYLALVPGSLWIIAAGIGLGRRERVS
ncbi:MAG: hypothetical protein AB7Q42_15430 [Acidimicrobiia bacterium]